MYADESLNRENVSETTWKRRERGFDECNRLFDSFNAIGCKLTFVEVV